MNEFASVRRIKRDQQKKGISIEGARAGAVPFQRYRFELYERNMAKFHSGRLVIASIFID